MNNQIQFGCVDTQTGQTQEGYIENGQMKFKPLKWWQKLFCRKPEKKEFIRPMKMDIVNIWTGDRETVTGSLYKSYNPLSGEIYSAWAEHDGYKLKFNKDAFQKGILVQE